jgi:hypothetical protein
MVKEWSMWSRQIKWAELVEQAIVALGLSEYYSILFAITVGDE